jgi:hypothetical protein
MHNAYAPDKLVYDASTGFLRHAFKKARAREKIRDGRHAPTASVHRSLVETEVVAQTVM